MYGLKRALRHIARHQVSLVSRRIARIHVPPYMHHLPTAGLLQSVSRLDDSWLTEIMSRLPAQLEPQARALGAFQMPGWLHPTHNARANRLQELPMRRLA